MFIGFGSLVVRCKDFYPNLIHLVLSRGHFVNNICALFYQLGHEHHDNTKGGQTVSSFGDSFVLSVNWSKLYHPENQRDPSQGHSKFIGCSHCAERHCNAPPKRRSLIAPHGCCQEMMWFVIAIRKFVWLVYVWLWRGLVESTCTAVELRGVYVVNFLLSLRAAFGLWNSCRISFDLFKFNVSRINRCFVVFLIITSLEFDTRLRGYICCNICSCDIWVLR